MGRVVCIANQKGGVGKTTTAINLSASLAIAGRRALLIDLDPQANASSGLGVRDLENRLSTYDLLMGESPVEEIVTQTSQQGLDILPAQRDLVGAEVELVQALAREHRLTEALKSAREQYDVIIIDCPPSLGLLTINGLTASNGVLIPLQCEYYALEGLSALMETVRLIRERLNPGLEVEGILLTMFDTRNSLSHQVAEEVRQHFGDDVFDTMIPRNVRLSESPSHGVPVAHYDATSKGAQAYLDLANEMMPREPADSPSAQPPAAAPTAADFQGDTEPAGEGELSASSDHDPGSEAAPSQAPEEEPSAVDTSEAAAPPSPPTTGFEAPEAPPSEAPSGPPAELQPTENIEKEVEEDGSATQSFGEGAGRPDQPGAAEIGVTGVTDSNDSSDRDNFAQPIPAKRDI